jgi:hypothetical protein
MGYNPKRTAENRIEHDNMIKNIALSLQSHGYYVQADHIVWINGTPSEYNGHIPDIIATNNNGGLIIEVEDCLTYLDEYTREQIKAFSKVQDYVCCMVVPDGCAVKENEKKQRLRIRGVLESWGINNVYVGI